MRSASGGPVVPPRNARQPQQRAGADGSLRRERESFVGATRGLLLAAIFERFRVDKRPLVGRP